VDQVIYRVVAQVSDVVWRVPETEQLDQYECVNN
jgi:hypothetical protein